MAEDDFDLCECICSNLNVQRLLYHLQQSQNDCTDIECFNMSRFPGPTAPPSSSDFYPTLVFLGFMALMHLFRPNSSRQIRAGSVKDRKNVPGPDNDPPAPPTIN